MASTLAKEKGTFDIIVIQEQITSIGDNKIMRGTLVIESVSPPRGHRRQIDFSGKGVITPCYLSSDGADDSGCAAQLVDDVKVAIMAHDKDCHHDKPCSE